VCSVTSEPVVIKPNDFVAVTISPGIYPGGCHSDGDMFASLSLSYFLVESTDALTVWT
jgi:hypothetical protein